MGASATQPQKRLRTYQGRSENIVYQAATDGFLIGYLHVTSGVGIVQLLGREGPTDPPASVMKAAMADDTYDYASFCLPVRQGRFYEAEYTVVGGAAVVTVNAEWQPFY